MSDIRELLIRVINVRFTVSDVESLLAYKMALFIILNADRQKLAKDEQLLITFESSTDLAKRFQVFEGSLQIRTRSSINSAMKSLEKAAVLMSLSIRPSEEEIEVIGLLRKPYLFTYIDLTSLREQFTEPFFDNNVQFKFFDEYKIPLINRLNVDVYGQKISLLAYQMWLYLLFTLVKDDFKIKDIDEDGEEYFYQHYIFDSYNDLSKYFSPFVDIMDIPQSTISDNLDTLHGLGLIEASFENPRDESECMEYEDRDYLNIYMFLYL
jgi:hypothetical protein